MSGSKKTLKARRGNAEYTNRRAFIAMVGDDINASAALSTADIGIAIGSGSDVAISSGEMSISPSRYWCFRWVFGDYWQVSVIKTVLDEALIYAAGILVLSEGDGFGWAVSSCGRALAHSWPPVIISLYHGMYVDRREIQIPVAPGCGCVAVHAAEYSAVAWETGVANPRTLIQGARSRATGITMVTALETPSETPPTAI
ncbi:hypothetical protein F5Y13DRAFT_188501 [Hypoxylon sp. FL1857]|nr:hypothetical protein F5Y13DRAFT_188501 [Hypoxylon sp. FL1857]